ncbi:MAG TPA: hypothetical protein VIL72_06370 [Beijerinckiaceae bacterium]
MTLTAHPAREPARTAGAAGAPRRAGEARLKPVKILLAGAIGVGKTSLVRRLARDSFEPLYRTTLGVEIMTCEVAASPASRARFVIWDTDGDFGAHLFDSPYVAGAAGVMGVADATRPRTIEQMVALLEAFERAAPGRPTCAVLTKCDLPDAQPPTLERLATRPVHWVSAASGKGVREAFERLARDIARASG